MIAAVDWSMRLESRRQRLHMSKAALARRARVPLTTVHRILSGKEKNPGIRNVAAIAGALGLEMLGEPQSAFEFRKTQATEKATRLVRMLQGTMALEAQAVDQNAIKGMVDQTACELLSGPTRSLWG